MTTPLHRDAIVVDGLQISRWGRDIFEEQHAAGITAVNCTCSVWEGFVETMDNIARWKGWFREHGDLLRPVKTVEDVHAAKAEGRVGVVLGFQNLGAIETDLRRLELFKELGVGVMQLAYNTQNLVGAGCYESVDRGLTDFGHEVVAEMNRLGILVDLSHVGSNTSRDAILASSRPVAYSHTCPAATNPHPRNKTDEEIRFIAERGGFVGVTLLPWFLRADGKATLADYVDAIEHVVNVAGEDSVGIGTDYMQGYGLAFIEWLRRDKGYARLVSPLPKAEGDAFAMPAGLDRIVDWPSITAEMERRGWPEERIRKLIGGNWLRLLGSVWH